MPSSASSVATVLGLVASSFAHTDVRFECQTPLPAPDDPSELQYGPSCSTITARYPNAAGSLPPQDMRILCPFTRMVQRVGGLPGVGLPNAFRSTVAAITTAFGVFGCDTGACGAIAASNSAGQNNKPVEEIDPLVDTVDVFRYWAIPGVAHDCGFTFSLGAQTVEDHILSETLDRLKELSYPDGHVLLDHIYLVQREACDRDYRIHVETGIPTLDPIDYENETIVLSTVGITEAKLIWTYAGGVDQGFLLWSDVARLLNAQMPERKTKFMIDFAMFALVPDPAVRNATATIA